MQLWKEAEDHFHQALTMNEQIGAWPYHVRTRRALANMLLERNALEDTLRALALIEGTASDAEQLGMAREVMRLKVLRERAFGQRDGGV
jgi:hypothetical protein